MLSLALLWLLGGACSPEATPSHDTPPPPDRDTHDTSDTRDSANPDPPASLPYAGTLTIQLGGGDTCQGEADAVVIGALNIAGNGACQWTDLSSLDLTLSGRIHEDGTSASGSVAGPKWLLSWQGTWTPQDLSGSFQDPSSSPPLSGSFSLAAER